MHAVVLEQVGIVLRGGQIVDRDDLNVAALGFGEGAQHVASDAAEAGDGDFHGHSNVLMLVERAGTPVVPPLPTYDRAMRPAPIQYLTASA